MGDDYGLGQGEIDYTEEDARLHLPSANEFAPGQLKADTPREVLEIAHNHAGIRDAQVEQLRNRYFADAATRRTDLNEQRLQQRKRANNVLIGAAEYGLFSLQHHRLTEIGEALLGIADDSELQREFGRHILRRCHGLKVLQAVRDLQARRDKVTKLSLQRELARHGFELSRGTTDHTQLLSWLRQASILPAKGYRIDEEAFADLAGVSSEQLSRLAPLSRPQLAYLRTLRRMAEVHRGNPVRAQVVLDQAEFEHGPIFRPDQIAGRVLRPLEAAGWIGRPQRGSGRGGKSGVLWARDELLDIDLELLTDFHGGGIPPDLRPRLNTPLADIQRDLGDGDKNVKGIALELLALRMTVDLGLAPLRFRERSSATGGAEVDLIAEGVHLHYSRWLFQCKNAQAPRGGVVGLHDLAKEVGMATLMHAHVIVMVTTGRFANTLIGYANQLSATTPLQVILLDGQALLQYRDHGPSALMSMLHDAAGDTLRRKRPQINESIGEE